VVTSAELARAVLVTHADVFLKGAGSERLARVMGDGLQVSEGEHHRQERALLDPVFEREPLLRYAETVNRTAARAMVLWRDGEVIDPMPAMRGITTEAILRALFPEASDADVSRLSDAVTDVAGGLWKAVVPGSARLERTGPSGFRRFRRAREALDAYVAEAVGRRRGGESGEPDLLASMLAARTTGGAGMSDRDARDEVISLLLAGRGTITAGLAWTWFLLARHPEAEERLHAEVDGVLGGDAGPTVDDLARLPFVRAVWDESLRVYPPAWVLRRKAASDQALGDVTVPAGSTLLVNVFGIHRAGGATFDPGHDPDPDVEPFASLAFGTGPRGCIGFHFATMEAVLLIAGIARRWRLEEVEPGAEPGFARSITLRPSKPIGMRLRAR
jgi:cytochrome P450